MESNTEEKVRLIFNDKEKVDAFVNDEVFMNKVSSGNAEPQDYIDKFKSFGVELSEDEAKKTKESVERILSGAPEEMSESELKDIAGGAKVGVFVPAAAPFVAGLGCSIASCVYYSKAIKTGSINKMRKYAKKADKCGIAAGALLGGSILLGSVSIVATN